MTSTDMARDEPVKVCPVCGVIVHEPTYTYCSNRCKDTAAEKLPKQIKKEVGVLMRCYRRRDWTEVE